MTCKRLNRVFRIVALSFLLPTMAWGQTMFNMQRLACHYSPDRGELILAMMSMSEQTHPKDNFQFRYELEVLLEVNAERKSLVENGDLRIAVIGDMVREVDRRHTLFRFNLVMDESGSIDNQSLEGARKIITNFFERIPVSYQAQIIRFTDSPQVLTPFTNDRDVLLAALNQPRASGGTAFYDAMDQALTELKQAEGTVPLQFTVGFTDGQDTTSQRFTNFDDFKRKVHMVTRNEQMPIFLAGIGEGVNHKLLKEVTGSFGFYVPLKSIDEIENLFEIVANSIEKTYIISIPISSTHQGLQTVYIKRRKSNGKHETIQDVPLSPQCVP